MQAIVLHSDPLSDRFNSESHAASLNTGLAGNISIRSPAGLLAMSNMGLDIISSSSNSAGDIAWVGIRRRISAGSDRGAVESRGVSSLDLARLGFRTGRLVVSYSRQPSPDENTHRPRGIPPALDAPSRRMPETPERVGRRSGAWSTLLWRESVGDGNGGNGRSIRYRPSGRAVPRRVDAGLIEQQFRRF
jgi:hypothetical protein